MKTEKKATVGRRDFLRTLGLGTGIAVAAVTPLATEAVADSESSSDRRKARYKETDHVKAFYRVNRYPSK
ncbi:MAG: twin-arginine translocation signal domain-containing protein [Rhizobiales bacterium]|nr:twin-arginine translocation signal domain-containing protein [Hyphomicrobiales bacterium]